MSKLPFRKVTVNDYVKELAERHDLSQKQVRQLLMWMTRNLCHLIERGEEVRIKGFGRIYFLKSKKP